MHNLQERALWRLRNLDLSLRLPHQPAPATLPPEARGQGRAEVKMMVLDSTRETFVHTHFDSLAEYLNAGDVLVVNHSATIPARLNAHLVSTQEPAIVHLAARTSEHSCIFERRLESGGPDPRAFVEGTVLEIVDGQRRPAATLKVTGKYHPNSRLWYGESDCDLFTLCQTIGTPIRYNYLHSAQPVEAYHTIFGSRPGSAEMPSASRPFTTAVLRKLACAGVKIRSITLHTSVSSHEVADTLANHPVLPEYYEVPEATAVAVNRARDEGRRVIAVGTTVVRALESAALSDGHVQPTDGAWTKHLVTPVTPPRVVTGLLTGMHESNSSHLALIYAFVRQDLVQKMYTEAVAHGYLWHEFGDTHLIL